MLSGYLQVDDLGKLLGLYAEWHSHLIPYYSFNQFVHKVEQVGGSKRVKVKYHCLPILVSQYWTVNVSLFILLFIVKTEVSRCLKMLKTM